MMMPHDDDPFLLWGLKDVPPAPPPSSVGSIEYFTGPI
jgi:hypothetical protein